MALISPPSQNAIGVIQPDATSASPELTPKPYLSINAKIIHSTSIPVEISITLNPVDTSRLPHFQIHLP